MARSLEAALIVPLSLATWLGMLASAAPCYASMRLSARLEVLAALARMDTSHLYQARSQLAQGQQTVILQTSPQVAIEIRSLIADGCGFFKQDGGIGIGASALQREGGLDEVR